jgi:DNA/RNA-binding domain of Phe-tRNA-synthetase-like protein
VWFGHSEDIWREYPELVAGIVEAAGLAGSPSVERPLSELASIAESRLESGSESELPEIQAWRRVFRRMGLEPTQYRCASEALLRRYRKDGSLPRLHPLVDLCNAASLAFAIPVAVFDADKISDLLEVRHAAGTENYLAFSGELETPPRGEVIFADGAGRAHARRWTNRQSAYSAVGADTARVLVVAEGVHDSAPADVPRLIETLAGEIERAWSVSPRVGSVTASSPHFELDRG